MDKRKWMKYLKNFSSEYQQIKPATAANMTCIWNYQVRFSLVAIESPVKYLKVARIMKKALML